MNTLADVNRHLSNPKISRDPRKHHILSDMRHKALNDIRTLDDMDDIHDDDRRFMDDVENARRGRRVRVGGYTRRRPRMDDDDDIYADDDWHNDDVEMRRRRSRRTGRFVRADDDVYPTPPVMETRRQYRADDDRMDDERSRIGPGADRR